MTYECESECSTSYYRCIDPIENFRIRVVVKPVKNPFLPLPQFDIDYGTDTIPFFDDETQQQEADEYTFKWQEKIFSQSDLKKIDESAAKNKVDHGGKKCPKKLFTYVEMDNYEVKTKHKTSRKKINKSTLNGQKIKNFGNIPKAKIINYYPSDEFKSESDVTSDKYIQKMFIMIDLGSTNGDTTKEDNHEVVCMLQYNTSNKLLEVTPSFSTSKLKPYVISGNGEDSRNAYYYWLLHASNDISGSCLRKEVGIMTKVLNHQEELKNLLIGTEFTSGQPNHVYVTLLGNIISAQNFNYDHLHINYFIKLSTGWESGSSTELFGVTHTSSQNSEGVLHFSHLFEINLFTELMSFEDYSSSTPEIIFEVVSVDKYNRYRNEGYSYIQVPVNPGMYDYTLECWRPVNKKIRSQLERFFIGGGPELEDVSYAGLSNTQKVELINRFGFETIPSGKINFKMNLLHQSEAYKRKQVNRCDMGQIIHGKSDTDTLLCSINTVLEAFRRARERMLEAKKGLDSDVNKIQSHQTQNGITKK